MKKLLSVTAVIVSTAIASVCFAQVGAGSPRVNGVVVNGNTTTVFEAADHRDLQMHLLTQWSGFAQDHQKIAHQLAAKPTLIDDAGYLQKHPDLEKLFAENPGLRTAMNRDPGNYLANLPQSEE
jgi:hypothetical protein